MNTKLHGDYSVSRRKRCRVGVVLNLVHEKVQADADSIDQFVKLGSSDRYLDPVSGELVFVPANGSPKPSIGIRDRHTFRLCLPCHPDREITVEVPFIAYDDGSAAYDTVEAVHVCQACQREFLFTHVEDRGRIALANSRFPLERQFHDLRNHIARVGGDATSPHPAVAE